MDKFRILGRGKQKEVLPNNNYMTKPRESPDEPKRSVSIVSPSSTAKPSIERNGTVNNANNRQRPSLERRTTVQTRYM
jgi:hypothetical protein